MRRLDDVTHAVARLTHDLETLAVGFGPPRRSPRSALGPEWLLRNFANLSLSGREDLNLRPFGPEPNALPGCATPRY